MKIMTITRDEYHDHAIYVFTSDLGPFSIIAEPRIIENVYGMDLYEYKLYVKADLDTLKFLSDHLYQLPWLNKSWSTLYELECELEDAYSVLIMQSSMDDDELEYLT